MADNEALYITILGPVDLNGNTRQMHIKVDPITAELCEAEPTIMVTAEEFRRLALAWDFPLNDDDFQTAEGEAHG